MNVATPRGETTHGAGLDRHHGMRSGAAPPPRSGRLPPRRSSRAAAARVKRNRLLGLAILAILALAVLAPAGLASVSEPSAEDGAAQRAARQRERPGRTRKRAANAAASSAPKAGPTASSASPKRRPAPKNGASSHASATATKRDDNAEVSIDCDKNHRAATSASPSRRGLPNTVLQIVEIEARSTGLHIVFPTKTFTFEGTEATDVIPIAAPGRASRPSTCARGGTRTGSKAASTSTSRVKCEPNPAFAIEKLQSHRRRRFTSEPLTGHRRADGRTTRCSSRTPATRR